MSHRRNGVLGLALVRRKAAGIRKLWHAIEPLEPRRLLTTYYVDNGAGHNGSDTNTGTTLSVPFLTIQKAALLAKAGDTVDILSGTYRESVTPARSGTASAPIIYQAYQNQKVVIDGTNLVGNWGFYNGNIYQSAAMTWTMGGQDDQVFVDGQMINYARWPNTPLDVSHPTYALAGAGTSGAINSNGVLVNTVYDPNLTQPAGYWVGATIHIESGQTWIYETATITSYTRAMVNGISYGVITYNSSFNNSDWYGAQPGNPYYITGDPFYTAGQFQDLDAPGQFYRDPRTGSLYVWTAQSDSPGIHVVEAKQRLWGFNLSGISYTNISGISLFACGIDSSGTSGHLFINGITAQYVSHFETYQGNWTPTYSNGLSVIGNTGIVLDGNYDTLENSTIAYSAGDGVFLGGSYSVITNNIIHDVGYSGTNTAGISTAEFLSTQITNDSISFNTVYNGDRSLINVSDLTQSRVDYNWLFNGALQGVDCGAIYGYGAVGNGSEIDHNYISNISNNIPGYETDGIFLDQGCTGFTIDHNLVFSVTDGIKEYITGPNNILNNTVADTHVSLNIYGVSGTELIANNITTTQTAIATGQPGVNVSNNIVTPTDPLFVSPSTDNFQLQTGSPAIDAGLAAAPYTNGFSGSAPDLGAYEYGSAVWTYGATGSSNAIATGTIPAPWTAADIGSPAIVGNSTYNNGIFAVSGSGTDIWYAPDEFQFVSTPVTGDQILIARLTSQAAIQGWSKAGLMFRANSSSGSPFVMVADTPSNGIDLIARDANYNLDLGRGSAVASPVWLELSRSGDLFTALDSSDGINWNVIATVTMDLPATGLMGMAVTAEDPTQISTTVFDNVSLQLPAGSGLIATAVAANQINLSWPAYANATGYQLQRSTDGINFTTIADLGAVTNYSDSAGLAAGTNYTYQIFANTTIGVSPVSAVATATTLTQITLTKPAGVTATPAIGSITISWNPVASATSYNIYRGTATGGESSTPYVSGLTAASYVDSSVASSTTYYYEVAAMSPQSSVSAEVSAAPLPAPLAKPTGVTATAAVGSITLTWNASTGATTYNVYRGIAASGESATPYATGVTVTSFTDSSVSAANTYYYYVTALLPESTASLEVSAKPLLAKPASVTATPAVGSITLTWNASTGATSYNIYRGTAAGGESKTAYATGLTTTSFTDTAVSAAATYYYYVTASSPESAASLEASAKPLLAKPTGVTATAAVGSVTLVWNALAGASSYNVYRGTTAGGEFKTPYATGLTSTTYTDLSVVTLTTYYYEITALSPESAASIEVSATALAPAKPAGVIATGSIGSITISWNASSGATAYNVFRGSTAGGEGTIPYAASIMGTRFTDTSATAGVTYYYDVTALSPQSSPSAEVSAASIVSTKLTGTPIGTSTSWLNNGDTIAQVFDGSLNTYFDAANGNLTNWVGLDLGTAEAINQIRYAPRAGYEYRMVGGQFQVSSSANFSSNVVTIATMTTAPSAGVFNTIAVNPGGAYRYVRYVGGTQWVNIAEMEADGIPAAVNTPIKLTGTPIGTSTSYLNNGDTIAQVFDGNFSSYFDAPNSSLSNWVGLDLGSAKTISQIKYAPRAGYEWRMVGGQFQASNTAAFTSGVVTLYTITTAPTAGIFTTVSVSTQSAYRYVRYVGGTGWVNIAEMEVDGSAAPVTPSQLTGTPIGTSTSWLNNGDTIAQVFDGNLNSYFDAPNSSLLNWVGLDLGSAKTITQIAYAPRAGYEWRMVGAQIQVSNTADFSNGVVTSYTITSAPTAGVLTTFNVNPGAAYRYIRYIGGTSWVNIAEMQVIGTG